MSARLQTTSINPPACNLSRMLALNIESSPRIIFNDGTHTCTIDSILVANQTDLPIDVFVYIEDGGGSSATPNPVDYPIFTKQRLEAYQTIDLMRNIENLYLLSTDSLFAYSSDFNSLFNASVFYRQWVET